MTAHRQASAPSNPALQTELQARLASPQGPAILKAYQARLDGLAAYIRAQLAHGVSPTDYAIGRALENAVGAASDILVRYSNTIDIPPAGLPTPACATPPRSPS